MIHLICPLFRGKGPLLGRKGQHRAQMLAESWLSLLFGKNHPKKNCEFHVHLDFRSWITPPDILNQATGQDSWQMVLRWAENMKNGGNEIRIRIFGGNMKNGWNEIQIRIFPTSMIAVGAPCCQMIVSVLNCNQLHHTSPYSLPSTLFFLTSINYTTYISLYRNQLNHTSFFILFSLHSHQLHYTYM